MEGTVQYLSGHDSIPTCGWTPIPSRSTVTTRTVATRRCVINLRPLCQNRTWRDGDWADNARR